MGRHRVQGRMRKRRLPYGLFLAAALLAVALGGLDHGAAAYLLPLFLFVAPLLLRRYPGEQLLARLAATRRRPPRPVAGVRRPPARTDVRRPQVMAWSLAVRPPPALLSQ